MFENLTNHIEAAQAIMENLLWLKSNSRARIENVESMDDLDEWEKSEIGNAKIRIEMIDAIEKLLREMVKKAI